MRLSRALALVERQFYLMRGSPARIVPLFGFVVIDIVLWGFITRYLDTVVAGMGFVTSLLGAVVLWDFCVRVLHGVTMTFFEDVWSRNFLNIFASPLSVSEYLAGQVVSSLFTSAVGLVAMVLLATLVFGVPFAAYGAMVVPFLLVLFLFGIAMGILGASCVLRWGPAAEWFVWPIPAVIAPFAGVFYPVSTLPAWMQPIARILPPAYVFESLRAIVTGGTLHPLSLLIGAALATAYVVAAGWVFTRVHRHAVRTGLIARYSAETIT
jgi:ABC-2 type transport system permease protein